MSRFKRASVQMFVVSAVLAMLTVGGAIGWLHKQRLRAAKENAAVKVLVASGADVILDGSSLVWRLSGTPWKSPHVSFFDEPITDAEFSAVADLPYVASVQTNSSAITDAAMRVAGRLTGLEELIVRNARMTDAGLSLLQSLHDLRYLNLEGCARITDAGLLPLVQLPNLKTLDVRGCTQVTQDGVTRLERSAPHVTVLWGERKDKDSSGQGEPLGSGKAPVKTGGE